MCVCVCVCVDDYSRATGYKGTIERYQRPQRYKGLKNNVAKTTAFRRYGLKISEKASMLISTGVTGDMASQGIWHPRVKFPRDFGIPTGNLAPPRF